MLINFKSLLPTAYVASIYDYDLSAAYARGKRLILFDIDNTLVPHGAPADGRTEAFFRMLKESGFRTCLISNNNEKRVRPFAERVGAEFTCKAGKPLRKGYTAAMAAMETKKEETLFIGDQILTDVLGANNAGIRSFLVRPVAPETDPFQVRLKRILERPVLFFFRRKTGNTSKNR